MAAGYSVVETWESRSRTSGTEPACTLVFQIESTGDDDAERLAAVDDDSGVLNALAAAAPSTRSGLPRQTMRIERNAQFGHLGIVEYHFTEFAASEHSFDTTGGTAKIFRSFQTMQSGAPPGKSAPNNYSLIGVTVDSIEGVDVVIPAYASKITKRVSPTVVTDAYKRSLFLATGTVNNTTFKEYEPGECLFLGAAGNQVNSDFWQLTFAFAGSPNLTNIQIPTPWGTMTVAEKKGWDYLWVRYVDRHDVAAKAIVKAPCAWYVERVYRFTNHNALGV
jgi:hypothetical protein